MPSLADISLRQLEYVVAVADELHFNRAAQKCHVSQPTLSAQVRDIENVLGAALFERDRKHVFLTEAGRTLVPRARRVLVEASDFLKAASEFVDPLASTIRLGVIPTLAPYCLPEMVPRIAQRLPKLKFVFREEKTEDIIQGLAQGTLDAGLLALEADIGEVESFVVKKDPFVVALPKDHPLTKKKRLSEADLKDEKVLLLDDGHCFRDQALEVCQRAGSSEPAYRATSLATLTQMVSMGAGLTLLPEVALPVENRRGQIEVRPLAGVMPYRTIALVWRPGSPAASTLKLVGQAMRGALA